MRSSTEYTLKEVYLLVLLSWFGALQLSAQSGPGVELDPVISPVNGLEVKPVVDGRAMHFYTAGHIFGAPGNSTYPSPTLLANLDQINGAGISFFMSLGDNFRQIDSLHISNFQSSFLNKLEVPYFNALGNHDLMPHRFDDYWGKDYEFYNRVFGPPYYKFKLGQSLFIVLDAEEEVYRIEGDQLQFFRKTLDLEVGPEHGITNLFIFSHKMLWNNPEYGNFHQTLIPLLHNTAQRASVHWFSGDLPSHPMIYRKEPGHDISYYAIALADDETDLLVDVAIDVGGKVTVTPISLTGLPAPSLDSLYSEEILPDEWVKPVDTVKPRKKKSEMASLFDHNYFWKGVMGGAGLMLLLALALWAIRRKK